MQASKKTKVPMEERKRKLLAEGALIRNSIMDARSTVRSNLNAESLTKGALNRIAGAVSATIGGAFASNRSGSLQAISPLLIGAVSMLSKRYLRKPLFYGGAISAAVAAGCYYLTRKRERERALAQNASGAYKASALDGE